MDRALLTLHNDWEVYYLDPRPEIEKQHNQPSLRAIAQRCWVTHTKLMRRYDGIKSKKDTHSSRQRLSPSEESSLAQKALLKAFKDIGHLGPDIFEERDLLKSPAKKTPVQKIPAKEKSKRSDPCTVPTLYAGPVLAILNSPGGINKVEGKMKRKRKDQVKSVEEVVTPLVKEAIVAKMSGRKIRPKKRD